MVTLSSSFFDVNNSLLGQLIRNPNNFRGMRMYFRRPVPRSYTGRFLYNLSIAFCAFLLNASPNGLIGMMIFTVSYLETFPIASMILLIGSSACCLYILILNTGSFLGLIGIMSLYFFLKNFGFAVFSIEQLGNCAAIAPSRSC